MIERSDDMLELPTELVTICECESFFCVVCNPPKSLISKEL